MIRVLIVDDHHVVRAGLREEEVLRLVASGLPNKAIASRLAISEKTVKAHLTSVSQGIGVTDRTQAARWAQATGWPEPARTARSR